MNIPSFNSTLLIAALYELEQANSNLESTLKSLSASGDLTINHEAKVNRLQRAEAFRKKALEHAETVVVLLRKKGE